MEACYQQLYRIFSQIVDLPPADWEPIRSIFQPKSLPKGQYLVRQGEVPQTQAFVCSGLVRLYYLREDGKEINRGFAIEHTFCGAISHCLLQTPSSFNVQAYEDSQLLVFRPQALQTHPSYWEVIAKFLLEHVAMKDRKEAQLLLDSPEERYQKFLEDKPILSNRLPEHLIAGYLNIDPATLSRIKKRLSG